MSTTALPHLHRRRRRSGGRERRDLSAIALVMFAGMAVAMAIASVVVALTAFSGQPAAATPPPGGSASALPAAPTDDAGVEFEEYKRPDPTLPAIPKGDVKKFKVDVFEHVTKVSDDLAPTRVWSYGINDVFYRGTGASTPMVVEVGDKVEIELINGANESMHVQFPHSIDYHSSEVNPGEAFKSIKPGERHTFKFTAKHPGVFMYHCATDPVLLHTGAGMVGMMVVKPKDLAPVDKELWINQQEFYFADKAGDNASIEKMEAKQPDVIAFNGYAGQYKKHPIEVKKDEKVRMYVLNSGPSIWSAFHVIGTVFDKVVSDNGVAEHVQTVNLAPSQGGYVEFTLDEEGTYPFVTHAFGDMVKGAVGVLATENAPKGGGGH